MSRALNPWDPQSERIWTSDGAWHSLSANTGGGQSRDCVLIRLSQPLGRAALTHISSDRDQRAPLRGRKDLGRIESDCTVGQA